MGPDLKSASSRSWTQLVLLSGAVSLLLGLLALVGWASGTDWLTTFGGGRFPMAPSTAVLFALFGGLLVAGGSPRFPSHGALAAGLAGAGTAAAMAILVLSTLGMHSPLEHLGMDISGQLAEAPVGHMSPLTALGFILAGASFLLMDRSDPWRARAAFIVAALLGFMAVVLTAAYVLSQPLLYGTGVVPPALNTALAFVALGGGLLGRSADAIWSGAPERGGISPRPVYGLLGIMVVAIGGILVPAYLLFQRFQEDFRENVEGELAAVANLKTDQILEWRDERLRDASAFYANEVFGDLVERALYRNDPDARARLENWLEPVVRTFQYERIEILDSTGTPAFSVPDHSLASLAEEHESHDDVRAMRSGRVTLEGFHRHGPDQPIHLTVIAPITGNGDTALGAIEIRVDPSVYLFPVLLEWPTPSRTAETLLVRRDGDDVLFLNDLRFREDAALNFRLPLSRTDLPAARAVLGEEGIVHGVDYRGEAVVAAVRSIPGTDWKLVARMDADEAYGPLRERLGLTLGFVGLLLLSLIGALAFAWQRREKIHFRQVATSHQRYQTLLRSIGDAVIATDTAGRVEVMNPVAEDLTGWTESEASGRPLADVFRIINENTRQPVESPVDRVLREGGVVGLANSTVLLTRDGAERPIADSGAPVKAEDGSLRGVILVFRDQTRERAAQRRLEDEVERAQRYLDVAGVMIVELDRTGRIRLMNERGAEILGYSGDEALGMDWFEHFIPADERRDVREVFERAMAGEIETAERFENRVIGRDGGVRTIAWKNDVLRDHSGQIIGTVSSGEDITQRRRAEAELRRSEARHRNLLESIRDAILVTNTDREIVDWNPAFEDLFGYEAEEIRGEKTVVVYENEDEYRRMGRALEGHVGDTDFVATVHYRKKSGEVFPGETNAFYLRDDAGEIVGFIGLIRDITERKKAEQAIRKQQEMLARTERIAHVGSWEMDVATGEVTWSDELFRIFRRDPSEGAPRLLDHDSLFPPEDLDRLRGAVGAAIERGEPYDLEMRAIRTDGEIRYCRARGYRETDEEGRTVKLYGSVDDITEQKEREERERELESQLMQAQKMEAVGRLAGGVAHDFNNMLSVILGHVEMVEDRLDPGSEIHEDLAQIRQAAESSVELTGQLLAFAREQIAHPEVADLNQVVGGMFKMLRRLIGEDIELRWNPADELWPVKIDAVQVNQILANLLINARDAMDGPGQVTIETGAVEVDEAYAEFHADSDPGDYVVISVADTGSGMEESVRERVFDPFFTTKEPGAGTGLGLATVYGIVRQNDGFITVYSEVGQGSTFKVYLPRSADGPAVTVSPAEPIEPPTFFPGDRTILVVEDQPAVLNLVEKILRREGYEVHAAETPGEAIRLVEEDNVPIDLLVTDAVMPEMNGRELATRLTAVYPDLSVLFMSGYAENIIAEHGVLDEGVDFLEKPFTSRELAAKVRAALTQR